MTSATINDYVAEINRLRAALADYACAGKAACQEQKLKDGTCIKQLSGECGAFAHDALEFGWE